MKSQSQSSSIPRLTGTRESFFKDFSIYGIFPGSFPLEENQDGVKRESLPNFFVWPSCTQLVQTGKSLVIVRIFCSPTRLFHTVFNRTVENFHAAFTFVLPAEKWRTKCSGVRLRIVWKVIDRHRELHYCRRNSSVTRRR